MSKKPKEETPAQLPEIILRVPTEQYGYAEIRVPIAWKDFMGTDSVKAIAVAVLNISDAIKEEVMARKSVKQAADAEKRKEQQKVAVADKKAAQEEAIAAIIKTEGELVLAKRKEIGIDVINDEAAAAIILRERQGPTKKAVSLAKTAAQKTSAPAASVDVGALPDADYGDTMRFFQSEYGWSMYLAKDKEGAISTVFDWLIAIPMENRHRRSTKYPCISQSGKYIMCNNYEKEFLTAAGKSRGMTITEKLQEAKEE